MPQGHLIPQQGHPMHRAHSFADYSHHGMDSYPMQQPYVHRHSVSNGPHQYSQIQEHQASIMHRTPSLPAAHASYYVPEHNNPGVATLNTNPGSIQTQYIPRQIERQEIVQSSPSSYSSVSQASPVSHDTSFYSNQPHTTYALHHSSPIEQQTMVQFQQQVPHHLSQQHVQPKLEYSSSQPPVEQYQATAPQEVQGGQWYDHVPYQAPQEVTRHVVPTVPQNYLLDFQDPWKTEVYDDPSLQMPSHRAETLQ